MAFYETVFFNFLKVPREFLAERAEVIRDKLGSAAAEFDRDHGHIFAINICLHLGSSVILSNAAHLNDTLATLRSMKGLTNQDPTTVLTVIALYNLVKLEADRAASEKKNAETEEEKNKAKEYAAKLEKLRGHFDMINWLVGRDAMRVLGFEIR